ncbi:integrase arm-type DNA-binding domain-containing protein [Lichenihabitans sp. Uapishka_5]|uniref:tyrosine-type recombinase/integrase n=1 Tax=Lichenihabitans sp. Uapishka_5 TaxID=3037302 RepID=UPI0029E7DDC0|nr:integrase arm-type DNA-binding domain-containing protein [Lichenihabitans sp. Uapishka_5]MDX7952204.1 integrase arm-type DNA-binding domain-containing protein [Lichenihabitans sp. Uapishka_5]
MGRITLNKLSARRVQALTEPGRHSDGGGLYLVVDESGAKRWVVFYRFGGKRREMGLGSLLSVPLARARECAAEIREKVAEGLDPIAERRATVPVPTKLTTFGEVADTFMADRAGLWRNDKHKRQWRQTLEVQAASLWVMPVAAVDTKAVLAVLRPIWFTKGETAMRLRGRIERVLDAARAIGLRSGDNPAEWRGHIEAVLPRPKKLARGHHAALPYADLPGFMVDLRQRPAAMARALELLILTAARSGEVRGMTWGEIDFADAVWTVPVDRMKAKRVHRVPLCPRAIEILASRRLAYSEPGDLVFPTGKDTVHSDMAFTALLKRMERDEITTHGFRSTFRDWAADETSHPREVIEAALAHLVGDDTERAYRRGDALQKRRALMADWAAFALSAQPPSSAAGSPPLHPPDSERSNEDG